MWMEAEVLEYYNVDRVVVTRQKTNDEYIGYKDKEITRKVYLVEILENRSRLKKRSETLEF